MPDPSRPAILFLSCYLPRPDQFAGCVRIVNWLSLLTASFRVLFATTGNPQEEPYRRQLQDLGVEVLPEPCPNPAALKALLPSGPPAGIVMIFYHLAAPWMMELRRLFPSTRLIVDSVDVAFRRNFGRARISPGDRSLRTTATEKKRQELDVYRQADAVIVVSDDDDRALEQEGLRTPRFLLPVFWRLPPFPPPRATEDLLFVGNFAHLPNHDAIRWFHDRIWPRVTDDLPGVGIDIIGPDPPPDLQELQAPGFRLLGQVPDLEPFLQERRLFVSPLRYGAGMKGKHCLALAHGVPLITTPVGGEGMHLVPGHDAWIARNARDFSRAIVRLYRDEAPRKRLARHGYRVMQKYFSLAAAAPHLRALTRTLLRVPLPSSRSR